MNYTKEGYIWIQEAKTNLLSTLVGELNNLQRIGG